MTFVCCSYGRMREMDQGVAEGPCESFEGVGSKERGAYDEHRTRHGSSDPATGDGGDFVKPEEPTTHQPFRTRLNVKP
jgi:hypothetical protein